MKDNKNIVIGLLIAVIITGLIFYVKRERDVKIGFRTEAQKVAAGAYIMGKYSNDPGAAVKKLAGIAQKTRGGVSVELSSASAQSCEELLSNMDYYYNRTDELGSSNDPGADDLWYAYFQAFWAKYDQGVAQGCW